MKGTSRRKFTPEFKTKVVLEALKERESIEELSKRFDIHPTQINTWKREFLLGASGVFSGKKQAEKDRVDEKELYAEIGMLKIENEFLKKKLQ